MHPSHGGLNIVQPPRNQNARNKNKLNDKCKAPMSNRVEPPRQKSSCLGTWAPCRVPLAARRHFRHRRTSDVFYPPLIRLRTIIIVCGSRTFDPSQRSSLVVCSTRSYVQERRRVPLTPHTAFPRSAEQSRPINSSSPPAASSATGTLVRQTRLRGAKIYCKLRWLYSGTTSVFHNAFSARTFPRPSKVRTRKARIVICVFLTFIFKEVSLSGPG